MSRYASTCLSARVRETPFENIGKVSEYIFRTDRRSKHNKIRRRVHVTPHFPRKYLMSLVVSAERDKSLELWKSRVSRIKSRNYLHKRREFTASLFFFCFFFSFSIYFFVLFFMQTRAVRASTLKSHSSSIMCTNNVCLCFIIVR